MGLVGRGVGRRSVSRSDLRRLFAEICSSLGSQAVFVGYVLVTRVRKGFAAKVCFSFRFWVFLLKDLLLARGWADSQRRLLASGGVPARGLGWCEARGGARVDFGVPAQRQNPKRVRSGWVCGFIA